jgi:glycosyltransferase involved in cell wall biosynthesis
MERLRNLNAGLGQYCLHLGRALAAEPGAQAWHFGCYTPNYLVGVLGAGFEYQATKQWHKFAGVATNAGLWHCMHQDSAYWPNQRKTPVAMTIHDLNFLERSDYSNWKKKLKTKQLQQKINRCKGLVYISEYVQKTVQHHLKVPAGVIEQVIYNGVPVVVAKDELEARQGKPYLFSIGLHPKKNYQAALPILAAHPEYHWIIAGADSRGYQAILEQAAAKLGVSAQLQFTGTVTEEQKWNLYRHCTALIFPSLSEGFGLPVLEAMAFGKPVFLSNRTSLPEIGGQEAYYFENFEAAHIQWVFADGMKSYHNDLEKPQRLKKRAAAFSWENAAREYLTFYHQILN